MATKKAGTTPAEVSAEKTTDPASTDVSTVDDQSDPQDNAPSSKRSVDDLTTQVLAGMWGDAIACRGRLDSAGYDSKEVLTKVNERLSKGAPGAYRPSPIGLLKQVRDGEWGDEKGLLGRLAGAGFGAHVVAEVLRNLEKS